jgi:hypothetical protein
LAQIQAEEGGSVEYSNVKDSDLSVVRQDATTMWPLIKAVSISTGSVLLRNGIRFMDLPGELNLISSIRKDGLTLNRLRRSQPNPYSGCE